MFFVMFNFSIAANTSRSWLCDLHCGSLNAYKMQRDPSQLFQALLPWAVFPAAPSSSRLIGGLLSGRFLSRGYQSVIWDSHRSPIMRWHALRHAIIEIYDFFQESKLWPFSSIRAFWPLICLILYLHLWQRNSATNAWKVEVLEHLMNLKGFESRCWESIFTKRLWNTNMLLTYVIRSD